MNTLVKNQRTENRGLMTENGRRRTENSENLPALRSRFGEEGCNLWLTSCAFVCFVVAIFAASSVFAYSGGTGEPNDPYQIADVNDLLELAADEPNYSKCFILTADINLASYVFTNALIAPLQISPFSGNFNGACHKISNLTINADEPTEDILGLFGYTSYWDELSEIKNLFLENVRINVLNEWMVVGGLVANNIGTKINNCHTNVYIAGDDTGITSWGIFGGLVGQNSYYGIVNNCSTSGDIFLVLNPYIHGIIDAGGLLGWNEGGTIISSHSDCNVIYNDDIDIYGGVVRLGGLVGANYYEYGFSTISNCYSSGIVIVNINQDYYYFCCGGLVGDNDEYAGNNSTIKKCFSSSPVIVNVDGYREGPGSTIMGFIGGLIGFNRGDINDCFSTGSVTASAIGNDYSYSVGGLVGNNDYQSTIRHCYFSGDVNVIAPWFDVGGLVGEQDESDINNSYFLVTSGPDNGLGEPLTDSQMKQQESFFGWDFVGETINGSEDVWWLLEDVTYPILNWMRIPPDYGDCGSGPGGGDEDGGLYFPDYNFDNFINFLDFAVLADYWLTENPFISLDEDDDIDIYDLKIFCNDWLEGTID